jgi:hypothetical protein
MPGHAAVIAPIVAEGAAIRVPVLGQGHPVSICDVRPKTQWTEAEVVQAIETQQKRAGALVALVRERTDATWAEVRRELNEVAGGQASARVMVLAHHAMRAHQALELQALMAEVASGEETKDAVPGLRNTSGLSVIATQALNQAYEAARAERKTATPTQQLMTRLGHGAKGPGLAPDQAPGGVAAWVPSHALSQSPPKSEEPK